METGRARPDLPELAAGYIHLQVALGVGVRAAGGYHVSAIARWARKTLGLCLIQQRA
jgi:hypothetical protein